ncbi:MAG: DUF1592 domain-containing protein [Planctomycetota bacterium]
MSVRTMIAATLSLLPIGGYAQTDEAEAVRDFASGVRPLINQYCGRCHGEQEQNADRRFDLLDGRIQDSENLVDYQDLLDQLNLGEMPPVDEPQPTEAERRLLVDWLTTTIGRYHEAQRSQSPATVLRRLNLREYRNTLRDLLMIDTTIYDPVEGFPTDQTIHHLDNIGESLVTSGHLLASYLRAADQSVSKAIYPLKQPAEQRWVFRDNFQQQPEIDQVHKHTNRFEHMTLYDVAGADKPEGAYGAIHDFAAGVPHDGHYEIRLRAEAVNRLHPYDDEFLRRDSSEPLRLGIVPGNEDVGELHLPQPIEPLLAELELADEPEWYTVRVWLDKGYTPRFTFRNGLMDARTLWTKLIRKYPERFKTGLRGIVKMRRNAIEFGELPQIRIHEIEIRGPLYDQWPRPSQVRLLGDHAKSTVKTGRLGRKAARSRITAIADLAYRRPVTDSQVDRIMSVVDRRFQEGHSRVDAFADGVKAILCSPAFLYADQSPKGSLGAHDLATRLAYFLWSTMPDRELRQLAESGKILREDTLRQQVDRLLSDPRSDDFVRDFLDGWLTLRDLGTAAPERSAFRDYYQFDLLTAMRRETFLFTRHLIDHDLSIDHFLQSDITFVDAGLARLYEVELPEGRGFRKVTFDEPRRGGLLGQASVLTVTANGVETSPVTRGVWVLENLLGSPPSPPPPDVEPLDPDTRGAKSIREQLQKHRNVAACNDCHRKIDPIGFALESFDPIGRERSRYDSKQPVDTSGQLPTGESFQDVADLKRLLLARKTRFYRALVEKMLTYATGRHLTPLDRPQIDRMVEELESGHSGMKQLIVSVVQSETFRRK